MRACRAAFAVLMALGAGLATGSAWGDDHWIQPTAEELSMTSLAQVPGAPALYLFREEVMVDDEHVYSEYVRMKILTEGGKKYSNVELKYWSGGWQRMNIKAVEGRTIHPDGTVIPFTGKPYEQVLEKGKEYSEKAKVFTLPEVTVGSIIEYRYKMEWEDSYYIPAQWNVQTELYMRKGHFLWKPTTRTLSSGYGAHAKVDNRLAWAPILPPGVEVKTLAPGKSWFQDKGMTMELNIADVPPAPEEDYMPPIASFRYRVLFYYTGYKDQDEFWSKEGADWSSDEDNFIGHGDKVRDAVAHLSAPTDAPEVKLKKMYSAVMELENTDYTRQRSSREDKAQGLSEIKTTDDILLRRRGSSDQLAALFVSMARAAGMKAYLMAVTSRERSLFYPPYLSMRQLDDLIAIVVVDGKEQYFDPGSRYCPYGHLAWQHTMVRGVRQKEGGTEIGSTPGESYKFSTTARIANLTLDEQGIASGKITLNYTGFGAQYWRQRALIGDRESIDRELKTDLEKIMPSDMEIKVASVEKLEEYEQPLVVNYEVKGAVGSATGKRLVVPGDLFESNEKATFVHETREMAVMFGYASYVRDVVRINFPKSFEAESVPVTDTITYAKRAMYQLKTERTPTSVTTRRDLLMGDFLFLPADYKKLRGFYARFESKDQEPVVLKAVAASAAAGS